MIWLEDNFTFLGPCLTLGLALLTAGPVVEVAGCIPSQLMAKLTDGHVVEVAG